MDECIVAMGINGREFLEDTMLNLVKDISIRGAFVIMMLLFLDVVVLNSMALWHVYRGNMLSVMSIFKRCVAA